MRVRDVLPRGRLVGGPLFLGALLGALAALALLTIGGGAGAADKTVGAPGAAADKPDEIKILFAYGSEKEDWIKWATDGTAKKDGKDEIVNPAAFNLGIHRVNGKRIVVEGRPLGSGETIEEVRSGRLQAHLISPASGAFVKIGNAEWRADLKMNGKPEEDLIGPTTNLVRSPVVIAMWKPMAEALGWPKKPIGWAEILDLAKDDKAWSKRGEPEWDPFKFGHTHPELSNSGLISIFAEVYAAPPVQKDHGLTLEDVNNPETAKFVDAIEGSVVFYGSSTGFFAKKMFKTGPRYLSAAVMYENMVVESYDRKKFTPQFDVVAIYPTEGTFMSDHPVGIVQREWVTDEQRAAGQKYIDFLRDEKQQKQALEYGFRPGLETIPLAAPLDAAHGVNPDEPRKRLQVPSPEVMSAIRGLWKEHRKQTSIVLVVDTSGSMDNDDRLKNAQLGTKQFVSLLGSRNLITLISFSDAVMPPRGPMHLPEERAKAEQAIDRLTAKGETALYDAIESAYHFCQDDDHKNMISAVIVLTDGLNNRSKGAKLETYPENDKALKALMEKIAPGPEKRLTPIFTIGYSLNPKNPDEAAAIDALKQIAKATEGEFYDGTPDNVEKLFHDLPKKGF